MARIETWLNQDLKEAVKVKYLDGNVFSLDNEGNLIGVYIYNNGTEYSGGGSVSASVVRADGATVACPANLIGNQAYTILPQSAYAVPGPISVIIKLTADGSTTTVGAVVANVYQTSTDTVVDPGTIIPSISALIEAIDDAVASIPPDYSELWASVLKVSDGYIAFSTVSGYVDRDDGQFKSDSDYVRTGYIKIPSFGLYIGMDSNAGPNGYVALYNSSKQYIGTFFIHQGAVEPVSLPAGAYYVALSGTPAGVKSMKMISEDGLYLIMENFEYNKEFCADFINATDDDHGGIVYGDSNNMITENMLYSPFPSYVGLRTGSGMNMYVLIYYQYGETYIGSQYLQAGNLFRLGVKTPFRLLIRKANGSRVTYSDLVDNLILQYTPYQTKAKLYFLGETPTSFPHSNATTSGIFNMIETPEGTIIAEDASHASNNAFVADFIDKSHTKFDFFVLSHWHDDHVGLLGEFIRLGRITSDTIVFLPEQLKSNFTTVFPDDTAAYQAYQQYTSALQTLGCTIYYPSDGERYYIDGVILSFWNTDHDIYYSAPAADRNYNDLSLCFYADIGNVRIGYPADLGPYGQTQCYDVAKKCNVWNAEHHGWDNGANNLKTNFIDRISPDVVVANDGAQHDTLYEQTSSPMVTWCLNNCVPFYRCYPQATGIVAMMIDGGWQMMDSVQRYRRSSN